MIRVQIFSQQSPSVQNSGATNTFPEEMRRFKKLQFREARWENIFEEDLSYQDS